MIEFESLKRKISEDPQSFIVIIGAGASVPGGLPTWNALKDMLCDALRDLRKSEDISEENIEKEIIAVNNAPNLWYTFSRLKSALGQLRYEKVIKTALSISGKVTPQLYKQLWELNVAGIINFNIDLFAINSHSEIRKSAVDYATAQEPHKYKNYPLCSDKFVLHPHGILSDAASWILTETDRSDLYTRNEDFKLVMTSLLNSKNLLVIGFNPVEWSFRELVNQIGMSRRMLQYI